MALDDMKGNKTNKLKRCRSTIGEYIGNVKANVENTYDR